jgi:hypothetical protein
VRDRTDAGPDTGDLTDAGPDAGDLTDAGPDAGDLTDAGPDAGDLTDAGAPCKPGDDGDGARTGGGSAGGRDARRTVLSSGTSGTRPSGNAADAMPP